MPKVNIREIDNTGSEAFEYLNYTVLIPGPKFGIKTVTTPAQAGIDANNDGDYEDEGDTAPVAEESTVELIPAQLLVTPSDFDSAWRPVGIDGEILNDTSKYKKDLGYLMIKTLLNKGLSVYYVPGYTLDEAGNVTPTQDFSIETPFTEKFKFQDKGRYDLRFITLGGLTILNNDDLEQFIALSKDALTCAGYRGDAVALLDAPENLLETADIDAWVQDEFLSLAKESISPDYRNGVQDKADASETFGRYGAMFAPFITVNFDGELKNVPTSFNYLTCFARYIANFKDWFAMSGSVRGISPLAGVTPLAEFGDSDINVLQARDAGKNNMFKDHLATNVVCNIRPYGNIIWGSRTMHPLSEPRNGGPIQLTASSFLNIRQLCCDIKKTLYRAARRFTFEPNSDTLWYNFKGAITPLLDEMKANQGLKGYQVIKVKTNKKALLVARIKIVPIEAVEDFDLTVELTDSIEVAEE